MRRSSNPTKLEDNAAQQRDFLTHLDQTLNVPIRPIHLTADCPALLTIIKNKGHQ